MPFVTRGGVRIHYSDSGGSGPPIVLAHTLFLDQGMFEPQVAEFGRKYRIILIDSRGHGPSEDDGTPFSYWDLARDAWAVVDALGLDRVTVGGVSHGAATAVRMALLAQSRVDGLILVGSGANALTAERRAGYREVITAWTDGEPFGPVARTVSSLIIGNDVAQVRPWRDRWLAGDRTRLRGAGECAVNRDAVLELLEAVRCPVLVIRGTGDHDTDAGESAELAAAFGVPVHAIDGAAMTPNLTHPREFNALLRSFLARDSLNRPGPGRSAR
ncbi:alpha/beta fold hydrolase [Nocardia huaxiensis]|uniref:Alpha/beta hydrolase n=1 Tax=Nocardia huaxiensis TaxID=2755382 RepID=A0A7D6ZWS8_9NOCA|nr:alpha/beta hydrolase [Nocardia huaxiensis]QLY30489.1 alpha/beta hydrolase [Nocardia huaxiensis]UFS95912.1 alpha/beta hydrolase [Nocardia huaxiensis]